MLRQSRPFFSRPDCKDAIQDLASAQRLALVVGAGSSADAGLPSWRQLIVNLVHAQLDANDIGSASRRRELAGLLVQRWGPARAATFARGALRNPNDDHLLAKAIADALHGDNVEEPPPGRFANHVAQLAALHDNCMVLTTNYDGLLRSALAKVTNQRIEDVAIIVDSRDATTGQFRIYHLHGHIDALGSHHGKVILDEKDYALQRSASWQELLLEDLLTDADTKCLFVGMSLDDPNIVRYLHSAVARSKQRHYGMFVRQDDSWEQGLPAHAGGLLRDSRVEEFLFRGDAMRLDEMGVVPIRPDYFGQVPQFLYEIIIHQVLSSDSMRTPYGASEYRYGARLMAWYTDLQATWSNASFRDRSGRFHELLLQARDDIVRSLPARMALNEHFSVHLWVRNPSDGHRSLELWGSSESIWVDHQTQREAPISFPTTYLAVETFCNGAFSERPTSPHASRWRYAVAQPVYLEEGPWFAIPVGVVTLSTTGSRDETGLAKLDAGGKQLLSEKLAAVGVRLLRPQDGT